MRERRSVIAPREMMKGSTRGRRRSKSSALRMRMEQVEEAELAVVASDASRGFELPHHGDQSICGIEDHLMKDALGPGAVGRRVGREGELKGRVQLDAFAASQRILGDHTTRVHVPGARQRSS